MKDKTALYILYQVVDEAGFEKIVKAATSKETWETLQTAYKGVDRVKQVRLQGSRLLRMKELGGVSDFITRMQTVSNDLKRNREKLAENRIVEKILQSLTEAFENVVCAIEESKDLNELSVDELAGSLVAHEERRMLKKESLEEGLQAKVTLKEKALFVPTGQRHGSSSSGGHSRCRGKGRGNKGPASQQAEVAEETNPM